MSRRFASLLIAVIALLAFALPAAAKERAVTKFDSLPDKWIAGQTYTLGYTIRMDGTDPLKVDRTEIVARSSTGATYAFAGVPDATSGHYTAKVMLPIAETYAWSVTQGPYFAPMDLGVITVVAAPAASGGSAPAEPATAPFALAIAALAAVLAGIVATRRRPLAQRTA